MKNQIIYYYKKYHLFYIILIASLYLGKIIIYNTSAAISANYHTFEMQIDTIIPFCKYFIVFYFTYYWFPPVALYLLSYTDKKKFYRIFFSIIASCIIANICFLIYQVKMVRPEIAGNDFFDMWVKWLYSLDPTSLNCCPSIHAIMGVFSIISVFKSNKFPKWLQIIGIIFGIGCAISTVFIKQHYFIDVVLGIIVAILTYIVAMFISNKKTNKYMIEE